LRSDSPQILPCLYAILEEIVAKDQHPLIGRHNCRVVVCLSERVCGTAKGSVLWILDLDLAAICPAYHDHLARREQRAVPGANVEKGTCGAPLAGHRGP